MKILAASKARQEEARRMNARAGENLFKVFSLPELIAWVMERLAGARRMTEVVNAEALRLPELDQALVGKVLMDNPDKILVLGREVVIEYRTSTPRVSIDFRGEQAKDWQKLPVEGIRLPGGREVSLYSVVEGYGYYVEFLSSQFVSKVGETLNKQLWDKFVSAEKPAIAVPEPPLSFNTQIPEVCEHQYGKCVVTDEPLVAFGVVSYSPKSYYYSEKFEAKWFSSRAEAEEVRTKSVEAVTAKQAELAEVASRNAGDIREVTIDRRGQYRKPELNGCRIDNRDSCGLTPAYFWDDLLELVEASGRGSKAFAIYRGDFPILVYLNREKIEMVLPQVQDLIKTLGDGITESTSEEKENFWRKLEEFRTKEAGEARLVREKREAAQHAEHEVERLRAEAVQSKLDQARNTVGLNSLGDAFAKFGL